MVGHEHTDFFGHPRRQPSARRCDLLKLDLGEFASQRSDRFTGLIWTQPRQNPHHVAGNAAREYQLPSRCVPNLDYLCSQTEMADNFALGNLASAAYLTRMIVSIRVGA